MDPLTIYTNNLLFSTLSISDVRISTCGALTSSSVLAIWSANIGHSKETKTCAQKLDTTLSLQTHGHIANCVWRQWRNSTDSITCICMYMHACADRDTHMHTHAHTRTHMHRLTCICAQTLVRKLFTVHHWHIRIRVLAYFLYTSSFNACVKTNQSQGRCQDPTWSPGYCQHPVSHDQ